MKNSYFKLVSSIILVFGLLFLNPITYGSESIDTVYKSILKIKTYTKDPISGNFTFSHYGSAVLISNDTLITNAHVVLGSKTNEATGYYEVCRSKSIKEAPICFSTATLESYDEINDIAKLKISKPPKKTSPLKIKDTGSITIGDRVTVFGYPSIGGKTITRTEGSIGGIDTDGMYKFDGTIDHGNSGGAALNSKGELIGIPRAIKSENGVIGYIIPIQSIIKFEKLQHKIIPVNKDILSFNKYIGFIQIGYGKDIIKDPKVQISNITKNGFTLLNKVGGSSGNVIHYHFADKTERTLMIVSCGTESFTTWKDSIDAVQKYTEIAEKKNQNVETVRKEFANKEETIYTIERIDKINKEGNKGAIKIYLYKENPTCLTYIISADGTNKDKISYKNAQKIVSTVKFKKTGKITKDFDSVFFRMKNTPNNTSISEAYRFLDGYRIYPEISVLFPGNKGYASSEFEVIEFNTIDEYMNYGYSEGSYYNGKNYTFQDFFNRYKTTKYRNVQDYEFSTNDQKKMIMTIEDYTDSLKYPDNPTQKVIFFYPFSLGEGKFYAYRIEFTLYSNDRQDAYSIGDVIKRIELPGVSPFK